MNALFEVVPWLKRQAIMDDLICQIAKRSQNAVWLKVNEHCMEMCPAEARGYIRVRAAGIVNQNYNQALANADVTRLSEQQTILEASLDRVVRSIMAHVRALHVQPVRRRRAA